MNTKGMKFLAVLAVLAVAFAAFAVVAPAETDDATDTAYTSTWNNAKTELTNTGATTVPTYVSGTTTLEKAHAYYVDGTVGITVPTGWEHDIILLFIKQDAQVTLNVPEVMTGDVWVHMYSVTKNGDVFTLTEPAGTHFYDNSTLKVKDKEQDKYNGDAGQGSKIGLGSVDANKTFNFKATSDGISYVGSTGTTNLMNDTGSFSGSHGTIITHAASATLTLSGFSGTVKANGATDNGVKFKDFTGKAVVSANSSKTVAVITAGAFTIDGSSYKNVSTTSGSVQNGNEKITFYDFAGQVTSSMGVNANTNYYPAGHDLDEVAGFQIDHAIEGRMTFSNENTTNTPTVGAKVKDGGLTVCSKATIDVGANVELAANAKITNEGKIRVSGTLTGPNTYENLENNGIIFLLKDGALIPATIKGTGSVNTDAVTVVGNLANEYKGNTVNYTPTKYPVGQKLVAAEDVVLKDNAVVIIQGTLEINAGVTITIEKGSQLIIMDSTGKLINNGTILNESAQKNEFDGTPYTAINRIDGSTSANTMCGGLVVWNAYIENNGTITDDYSPASTDFKVSTYYTQAYQTLNFSGMMVNEGSIVVGDDSVFWIGYGNFYNKGSITVYGVFAIDGTTTYDAGKSTGQTNIENYATIAFIGGYVLDNNKTVFMMSTDAKIVIDELKSMNAGNGTNSINFTDATYPKRDIGTDSATHVFDKVSTVSIKLVALDATTATAHTSESISGLVIGVSATKCSNTAHSSSAAYLVSLTLDGTVSAARVATGSDWSADVKLAGEILTKGEMDITDNVLVTVGNSADNIYTISGTVTAAQATTYSGLAFESDATSAATFTVTGKFIAYNNDIVSNPAKTNAAKYDIRQTAITPKMYVYTTLATAIADGAESITTYGDNTVDSNITIPSGTTVTNNGKITIKADKVLTVSEGAKLKNEAGAEIKVLGTLIAEDYKNTFKGEGTVIADIKKVGTTDLMFTSLEYALNTAVPGDIITVTTNTLEDRTNDITIPAGVVLDIQDTTLTMCKNTILTVDGTLVMGSIGKVQKKEETLKADDVKSKFILNGFLIKEDGFPSTGYYTGEFDGVYYTVTDRGIIYGYATAITNMPLVIDDADDGAFAVYGDSTVGSLSLAAEDSATLTFHAGLTANLITLDNTTLKFAGAYAVSGTFTNGDGSIAAKGKSSNGFSIADSSDKLTFKGAFADAGEKEYFTVSGNTYFNGFSADVLTVNDVMTVSGTNTASVGALNVNGTVKIDNDKVLKATTASVLGNVVSAEKTSSKGAGTFNVTTLWVGLTDNTAVDAAAAVSGKIILGSVAYVLNGASVPESILELPSTEYYVEGKLWLTAYAVGNVSINAVGNAPTSDSYFDYWLDEDGDRVVATDYVGTTDVSAKIDYDIYQVTIVADAGIGSVKVGDIVFTKSSQAANVGTNTFVAVGYNFVAGTYNVALQAASGYNIDNVKLTDEYGINQNMKVVLSGVEDDNADVVVVLYLTGSETIDITPAETPEVEQQEWTITTILLLVLVILIAIMAVIVAIRLNRS